VRRLIPLPLLLLCACPAPVQHDPATISTHRLSRIEYVNTVRDLLGVEVADAADLPPDDPTEGYDHVAEGLATSPLHVELWEHVARQVAGDAMAEGIMEPLDEVVEAESGAVQATAGGAHGEIAWNLNTNGEIVWERSVPHAGRYRFSARVWGQQAGPDLALATLAANGLVVASTPVEARSVSEAEEIAVEVELHEGLNTLAVGFANDYWVEATGEDRNLFVDWLRLEGPTDGIGPNPRRAAILRCEPADSSVAACAEQILRPLARRAFRRPPTDEEVASLVQLVQLPVAEGDGFDDGVELAITALLLSPSFLFQVEVDPAPGSDVVRPLTDWEIASRLSYFLWSSMPDDTLLDAAAAGELQDAESVRVQALRMLDDPRADALAEGFAGQWLFIRGVADAIPDPWAFADFDEALRDSMAGEMRLFFESFLRTDRSLRELLSATEGAIDERLAAHYEVDGHPGGWATVDLGDAGRGGVLGQAGWLTATSYPARTSPVRRGKWVMEQLLCTSPPPPPPEVESFVEDPDATGTLRERFEAHRADPTCAACHQSMDEYGFALEAFDGIGQGRDTDGGAPIDDVGLLPDGTLVPGHEGLVAALLADPRLEPCIARQLYVYALGRVHVTEDALHLRAITEQFVDGGHSLSALVSAIVTADSFRLRRGGAP